MKKSNRGSAKSSPNAPIVDQRNDVTAAKHTHIHNLRSITDKRRCQENDITTNRAIKQSHHRTRHPNPQTTSSDIHWLLHRIQTRQIQERVTNSSKYTEITPHTQVNHQLHKRPVQASFHRWEQQEKEHTKRGSQGNAGNRPPFTPPVGTDPKRRT